MPRFRAVVMIELETESLQQAANYVGQLPVARVEPGGVVRSAELTKIEKVGA